MASRAILQPAPVPLQGCARRPSIVIGITHPQTCLVLGPHLRTLRQAGFRVILVASPGELLERAAADEGVERVAIRMERRIAPLADFAALCRLWRLLGREKPDLVEFSTPKAGLLGMLAATFCGVPRRIYRLRGLRLETERGWKRRILAAAEWMSCACAHVVLCNSESLREKALALRLVAKGKIRLLGDGSSNGVDMKRYSPGPSRVRERLGWSKEARVVGYVGRLTRDKGLPELIEGFEAIARAEPEARLLLVGWFDSSEDPLGGDLRARIGKHPHIHCTGFVEDTAPYYRAMDVMVLPTWREGFPNAVLEAQASGIPVVTTISTGARDSVVAEVTGLLIPPGYPEAISEAVLKLLRDPARRRRMGRAARPWVREVYVDRRVLGLTAGFYHGVLQAAKAGTDPVRKIPIPQRAGKKASQRKVVC